ncbi:Multidrug resistance protein A [Labilithrix luteola]|uniref:Multidrug resistance protein A n=2 Tax=Labilithrix luteola TaxID=1391654 RepID=A0A0K1PPR2_9BACT|nr:Multidrug resistance protein A [Labilithrix luteola]
MVSTASNSKIRRAVGFLRTKFSFGGLVTAGILLFAGLAAAAAQSDRKMAFPINEGATDDAFVRADITPLSSRVEGHVLRVLVQDNERVRAGQLLVEIDPADFEAKVREGEARVAAAQALLESNRTKQLVQRNSVAAASAAVDATSAGMQRAELEAQRHDRLSSGGLVSAQDHERATYDALRARAELRQRGSERDRSTAEQVYLDAERRRLEAELSAANAMLDLARIQLGYTRIVAPANGVVGERGVRVGQLVRPGSQIIHLVAIDDVWVTANFKERQVGVLQPGTPVRVTIDTFPGVEIPGVVDSLSPASGAQLSLLPPDNATGNFTKIVQRIPVKIALRPPRELAGRLIPGMSAVVSIERAREHDQARAGGTTPLPGKS